MLRGEQMPRDRSDQARTTLETVLRRVYGIATPIIKPAAGGFVVGLVDRSFATSTPGQGEFNRLMNELESVNAGTPDPQDRVAVFTLRFYSDEKDAFNKQAALRFRPAGRESGGWVHYTSAQDAFLLAHEIDAEAILTDPEAPAGCRVIRDDSIVSLAATPTAFPYRQFELDGRPLTVDRVEDLGNGVWEVHVAAPATTES